MTMCVPDRQPGQTGLLGGSPQMQAVREQIRGVGPTNASVMLIGESGSGEALAVRAVHEQSARAGDAFVAIKCGAILPSLSEAELFGHDKRPFYRCRSRSRRGIRASRQRHSIFGRDRREALRYFEGNKTQTAVALGCSLEILYNKLNGCTREAVFSHS